MARLSKNQEQARQQILQLEGLNLLPKAVGSRVLAALQHALPSDESALFGVDPTSLLFNQILAYRGDFNNWRCWLQEAYLIKEPFHDLTFPGMMQANLSVIGIHDFPHTSLGIPRFWLELLPSKDWWHLYHEIHAEASGILRACFIANGRWIAALQLVRDEPRRPFRTGDISFIRLLTPLIGRVLHQSYERERAIQTTTVGPDVSGILVIGANKQIQVCTPAAEAWIEHLGGSGLPFSGNLPTAIWAAIARLRADVKNPLERALHVWTPAGNLRIEASKSNIDGSTVIVLTPERPPIPPDLPIHWQLTPKERQIVLRVVQGFSNRQIAATLIISENTVESHLAHVYEKLSIHSRSELLACLFRDAYWTQIQSVKEFVS